MKTTLAFLVLALISLLPAPYALGQLPNPREIPWPPKMDGLPTIAPGTRNDRTPSDMGSVMETRGEVELMIVKCRSQADAEIIRGAFWRLLGVWHDPETVRIAAEKTRKNKDVKTGDSVYTYASTEEASQALAFCVVGMGSFGLEPARPRFSIRITGSDLGGYWGQGTLGLPQVTGPTYERRIRRTVDFPRYSIEINRNFVRENPDQRLWASVIWHEMLHNIGFDHGTPRNASDNAAYDGFLITEWDNAIVRGTGLWLTDAQLRLR